MDPYGADGELINIHTAFHQAQYDKVIDFDTSNFSSSNDLPVQMLKIRALCALNRHDEALASLSEAEASSVDIAAAKLFVQYAKATNGKLPTSTESILQQAEELASTEGDNLSVQLLCGSVLAAGAKTDEALQVLKRHQGSLDAAALMVQIHLMLNRTDLAAKEARAARGFGGDALVVNLCEAWLWMRQGGDKYQQAFYVFEDLAQGASTKTTRFLNAQAVSEIHLGRWEEAETALKAALELSPENVDALANQVAWTAAAGRGNEAFTTGLDKLKEVDAGHALLRDLTTKREAFAAASAKYDPKLE